MVCHGKLESLKMERYLRKLDRNSDNAQAGQRMKWFPPTSTPGVPPSNGRASDWYQQTSVSFGSTTTASDSSGILRLEDLQAQFGTSSRGGFRSDSRGQYQERGHYSRNGGSGYYQNQYYYGSGYRDRR